MADKVVSVKGFDANMQCRGYQFEVGKTYTHDGDVVLCESGFHACENPLDVLSYYNICDSRFALVEQSGEIARHGNDSKIASAVIAIQAELRLPDFIRRSVAWIMSASKTNEKIHAVSGSHSKLAASGYASQLAASGDSSKLAASGDSSQLAASGDYSQIAASGYHSVAMAAGRRSLAKAGSFGAIALTWNDGERPRISVGYVGEGLKPDTWYALNSRGEFVEAEAFES